MSGRCSMEVHVHGRLPGYLYCNSESPRCTVLRNQLAAVFLKLGFEEEAAFSMMDAIMKAEPPAGEGMWNLGKKRSRVKPKLWIFESLIDRAYAYAVHIGQDLLPGCHYPDLHGLFRDTGVADTWRDHWISWLFPACNVTCIRSRFASGPSIAAGNKVQ